GHCGAHGDRAARTSGGGNHGADRRPTFCLFVEKRDCGWLMLEARNITVNYDSRVAVEDVSLRVEPSKVISIIGPNGAGKSTLLRTLNGNVKPTFGEVNLDDRPVDGYARRVLAQRIAVVAQEAGVRFPVTVFEFVLGGRYAWANVSAWGWESERDI